MIKKSSYTKLASLANFCICFCLILLTPLCIIYFSSPTANTKITWDWANALGYISISIALLLFIFSGKTLPYPKYTGKFFVNFHRDLGFIALILVGLHIAILLITEPVLIEHIKLTAPIYMLAGLLAAILIVFIVFSSIRSYRKKLWKNYQQFRQFHNLLSIITLILIGVHVVISRFYVNHSNKFLLLLILSSIAIFVYTKYKWFKKPQKLMTEKIKIDSKIAAGISYGTLFVTMMLALLLVLAKHFLVM